MCSESTLNYYQCYLAPSGLRCTGPFALGQPLNDLSKALLRFPLTIPKGFNRPASRILFYRMKAFKRTRCMMCRVNLFHTVINVFRSLKR